MTENNTQTAGCLSRLTAELDTWQPIETAPKDGTAVLLCWAVDADKKMIDWQKEPKTADVFVQVASWWEIEDSWIVYASLVKENPLHFTPTHWMPLPKPPMLGV